MATGTFRAERPPQQGARPRKGCPPSEIPWLIDPTPQRFYSGVGGWGSGPCPSTFWRSSDPTRRSPAAQRYLIFPLISIFPTRISDPIHRPSIFFPISNPPS